MNNNYTISLKKLEKIANPFEQISFDYLKTPLTIEELNDILENGKQSDSNDDLRCNLLNSIVEKIINFNQYEVITIDLETPVNINSGWVVKNVEQLAALLYWKDHLSIETVNANIQGKENVIKDLFNPIISSNYNFNENSENNISKYKIPHFNWKMKTPKSVRISDLEMKKEILKEDDLSTIISLSKSSMWNDPDFFNAVLDKYKLESYLSSIPIEYLCNETSLMIAKENITLFKVVLYMTKDAPPIKNKVVNKVTAKEIKRKDTLEILKTYLNDETIVLNLLKEILKKGDHKFIKFCVEFIPDRILMKQEIMDISYELLEAAAHDRDNMRNALFLFPKRYFYKENNVLTFFERGGSGAKEITNMYLYEYILKHVVKNKETILSALNNDILKNAPEKNKINMLDTIYGAISYEIKSDIDIIKKLIELGYTEVLNKAYGVIDKLSLKTIENAFIKDYRGHNIPNHRIFQMKSTEARTKALLNKNGLMSDKDFPYEWLLNTENLKAAARQIVWKRLPENIKSKILEDKEILKYLIQNNLDIYGSLPLIIKIDNELVNIYSKKIIANNEEEKYWKDIPKSMWLKKDFAAQAIKHNVKHIKQVPKIYLNDKDFIIKLFTNMSEEKAIQLLAILPKEIITYLNNNNVSNNYVTFLEKAFFKDDLDNTITIKENTPLIKKNKI